MAQSLAGESSPDKNGGEGFDQFNRLALDLFSLQFQSNAAYRRLCQARGLSLANVARWEEIPAVPASAFKELDLTCLPVDERSKVFHSSGTTGQQPSRHFHGRDSLALYEASLTAWFGKHLHSEAGATLVSLTPDGIQAPHSSLVHMFDTVSRAFGTAQSIFCGEVENEGAWFLSLARADSALRAAVASARPVTVMGTAFNFVHLLDRLADLGERIALPPGSCALETGGYKGRSRVLAKSDLHAFITDRLGIPPERIVCEYGMSELSSQAYDLSISSPRPAPRASRLFRFPPWARVQIVSPETGREVAEGETGLLRIFDLANVWSVLAVQTEDLAIRRVGGFELLGRAAAAEPRGCSLMVV